MSEYQYYEFQAIDRPLSANQMSAPEKLNNAGARRPSRRAKQLKSLVGQEEKLWTQVHDLVATKLPKNYDQAVKILIDLRDLAS